MKQFFIAIDQLVNVPLGSGWADETISAWAWRTKHWLRPWIDRLFFWDKNHCEESYKSELERRQLPPEYRGGEVHSATTSGYEEQGGGLE